LQFSDGSLFYPDYFTHLVGVQTRDILGFFGFNSEIFPHETESSLKLILNDVYVARIIEGCNGVSVLILFVSFVIAFSGKLKTTFFYSLAGSVLIYVVNVLRIVILSVGIYKYPKFANVLHEVVFPAIIYGFVFLLWIFWVNSFSKLHHKHG